MGCGWGKWGGGGVEGGCLLQFSSSVLFLFFIHANFVGCRLPNTNSTLPREHHEEVTNIVPQILNLKIIIIAKTGGLSP